MDRPAPGARRRRAGWLRANAPRLIAVAVLIPVFAIVTGWQEFDRAARMQERIAVTASAGEPVRHDAAVWQLDGITDPAPAVDAAGEPVQLPEDTRLVIVELQQVGPTAGCEIRLRDAAGRTWEGRAVRIPTLELEAAQHCSTEPGERTRLSLPFVVPADAEDLSVEVLLARADVVTSTPTLWARIHPG